MMLSRRYGPAVELWPRWSAAQPFCVDLPPIGVYNETPDLDAITVTATDERPYGSTSRPGVPKAVWTATVVRDLPDRVEVAVLLGRSGNVFFEDDCALDSPVIDLPTPLAARPVVAATDPATIEFQPAVSGGPITAFSFDSWNVADGAATIGDDLIAQSVDDLTVQFQVSDVFGNAPIASEPRAVLTDQWPVVGQGRLVVLAGTPAGTYQVHLVDHPELNGRLEVLPPGDGWGWWVPISTVTGPAT
ncbi:MAG: hypothetical protein R2695_13910 [Acidimicrobiales bacterium]